MSASRTIRKLTVLSHVTSILASYEFITLLCLLSWVTDWSRWLVLLTYLTEVIFLPERRSYCFLLLGANYMIWYPWTSCIATVTSIYSFQHSKYSPHTYYYKPSISPSWFFRPSLLLIFLTFYIYHLYYTWMLCNPNNKKRMGKNFMLQVSTNELFTDISLDLSSSPVRHLLLSIPFTQLKNRKKQIPVKTWWNSDGIDAQTSVPVTTLYLIPVVFLSMNNLMLLPHFVVSLFFLLFFFPAFLRKNSYIIGWGQF